MERLYRSLHIELACFERVKALPMMANRYAPIEDYGIIGDLHTVALVGKTGSPARTSREPRVASNTQHCPLIPNDTFDLPRIGRQRGVAKSVAA